MLREFKIKTKGKVILDVGSGAFAMVDEIKDGANRYAIDPLMNEFKKNFKLSKDVERIQGMGENLPYPDRKFDIVFCINALDHCEDPLKVIQEAHRCLKFDGTLFLTVNCYSWPIAAVRRFSEWIGAGDIHHPYSYTVEGIETSLKVEGFRKVAVGYPTNYIESEHSSELRKNKPFTEKLKEVQNLRGTTYIFKRALVLPLHFIARKLFNEYDDTIFIFTKECKCPNLIYGDFDLDWDTWR